ncbi:TetR family transcriptional regulator [Enterococcus sp. JM4C]|uniref:TetR/AcrR family transcriptional regulator n=1 Tax=Candidatus Enterococcus huntleyi TaxID=1857217 RepID=UPI00137AB491|nr:TetR/AcrR family transcriptional regulator [Enterococcus sp. JM4C]KAF1297225.1 TetR family transcriptional regulator [Enterococcus sp. JM4C]
MARKKTITREQILKAAHDVVATEGFSRFTARNIANKMKCSTQPIYLEFKNMDDLKDELYKQLHRYLSEDVFQAVHTGKPLIDLALNYIHFAVNESGLYRALYLEYTGAGEEMQEFSYECFLEIIKKDPTFNQLTEERILSLHTGTWIVATGVASLMTSGIIQLTDDEIEALIQDTIDHILSDESPVKVNF